MVIAWPTQFAFIVESLMPDSERVLTNRQAPRRLSRICQRLVGALGLFIL